MFAATLQAAALLLLAAGMATYVALRPVRSALRGPLLGVLVGLMLWATGVIWRFAAPDVAGAFRGFVFGWIGTATLPSLWLLLAARAARVPVLDERPQLAVAAFVPPLLAWAALATNPHHHLFLTRFTQTSVERGPLFYAFLVFAYPCIAAGVALLLVSARRMWTRDAWGRGLLVASAALLPTLASALFVFGALPIAYDPTPAALGLGVLLLTVGVFRLQFLDALPLARRDVIDHLRDGVVIADPGDVVIDANPSAVAILGGDRAALRGRPLAGLLGALASDPRQEETIGRALARLVPDESAGPWELRTGDGRHVELLAKCLRAADGAPLGRFAVLRDRTEERRYEHLLRQSQKLETVGSLAAGVAHEVNNPLAFVRANLRQIERMAERWTKHAPADDRLPREEREDLEELPQLVAECIDGIERIARIVDAMRRFSRIPSDELGAVDVNRVVEESIRLATLHRNRGVRVESWLDDGLPAVHGSASRLTQVVVNLLVNAKQACAGRRAGHISVRTRRVGEFVEVQVSDDGPGIPEAIRERIFDPFFTTKGPEEGTGLGLSIAFDIVREHGGLLELRPTGGGGACFRVQLPVPDGADALAAV